MERHQLDRLLEAAVVRSWPELAPDDGLIHVEYELGATGKITFLRVWLSKRRGVWHLICTWSASPPDSSNRQIHFETGYVPEEFNGSLISILQHQDAFVLPPNHDGEGLLQIGIPTERERAAAGTLIREALNQIASPELAAA